MLKSTIIFVVVLFLVVTAIAWLLADRLIFFPPPSSYSEDDFSITMVPTDDGVEIATTFLHAEGSTYTILLSHGNAEDLGHGYPILRQMQRQGFSVLAYDYRGYGLSSPGRPTTAASLHDIAAVYRHATEDLGIHASRIILYGRSVGSGPSTDLASREPVGGLILESGFTSAFRVVTRVPLIPFDRYPNLRLIRDVDCPVLIIHGTDDEVVPFRHGKQLFAAAPEPKRFLRVEGGRHNNVIWMAGDEYWQALRDFSAMLRHHEAAP